ncbi:ABC transporter substrate-binding protein, partial [Klebsiella pneumoniae]
MSAHAALDLRANEQPLPVTRDPQAIAKIPPGYRFVEPGTLTVAISALNSPPLAQRASANPPRLGRGPA